MKLLFGLVIMTKFLYLQEQKDEKSNEKSEEEQAAEKARPVSSTPVPGAPW